MNTLTMHDVAAGLRSFPHEGVTFWDLNSIMHDGQKWRLLVDTMANACRDRQPDMIVGLDARGFLLAGALAYVLGTGKVMGRKKGKLPGKTVEISYGLEYRANDVLELQDEGYILPGMNVLIVDDVLATGGTALAAAQLIEQLGAAVTGILVAIELPFLNGRAKLGRYPVHSCLSIIDGQPQAGVSYCTDVIAETYSGDMVMIKRLNEPGGIAFPGGHIDPWEAAEWSAMRELMEETGLTALEPEFVTTLCTSGRDPRGRKVSLLYRVLVGGIPHEGEPGKTEVLTAPLATWAEMKSDAFAFDTHQVLETYVLPQAA